MAHSMLCRSALAEEGVCRVASRASFRSNSDMPPQVLAAPLVWPGWQKAGRQQHKRVPQCSNGRDVVFIGMLGVPVQASGSCWGWL